MGKPKESRCLRGCKIVLTGCGGVGFPLNPEECARWCEEGWGKEGDKDNYVLRRILDKRGDERSCSIMEFEIKAVFDRRPPSWVPTPVETPTEMPPG